MHGYGGVIVLGSNGDHIVSFTTERMSWACAKEGTLHHGIEPGEDIVEPIVPEAGEKSVN